MTAYTDQSTRRLSALIPLATLAMALSGAALAAPATSVAPAATAAGSPCGRVDIAPMMTVPVGKSSVIRPQVPVTRILLGNPDNVQAARPSAEADSDNKNKQRMKQDDGRPGVAQVDVLLLSPNEIYLLGKSVGSTNVVLVDRSGGCTALDVTVAMDVTSVQAALATLLPDETEIKVNSAYDSLVLSGTVSDATKVDRAIEIASAYVRGSGSENGRNQRVLNMLKVGAPQQVMLEVKVAEISKAVLDRFGIDLSRAYTNGSFIRFLSGIFGGRAGALGQLSGVGEGGVPLSSAGVVVGGTIPGAIGSAGNITRSLTEVGGQIVPEYTTTFGAPIPAKGVTNLGLDMQKTDGLVKILAEPNVMAISGQEGSFLAGGKIFIPVAQSNGNGGQTITLEEKEFGVSVKFTPTVLDGGRINLAVRPEVSELNREGVGLTAPGVSGLAVLPAFTTRRAFTTVQLQDGQSFAIGGLIKNNTTNNIRAFPFLGELPILGALFRSTEFQTDRSELVFVITPRLVKPLPPDYALPTDNYIEPSRSDLIWRGKLEGDDPPQSEEVAPSNDGGFAPN